jgi:hypothetical protein
MLFNYPILNDEFDDSNFKIIKESDINSNFSKSSNLDHQKLIGNCLYFFDEFIKICRYYS